MMDTPHVQQARWTPIEAWPERQAHGRAGYSARHYAALAGAPEDPLRVAARIMNRADAERISEEAQSRVAAEGFGAALEWQRRELAAVNFARWDELCSSFNAVIDALQSVPQTPILQRLVREARREQRKALKNLDDRDEYEENAPRFRQGKETGRNLSPAALAVLASIVRLGGVGGRIGRATRRNLLAAGVVAIEDCGGAGRLIPTEKGIALVEALREGTETNVAPNPSDMTVANTILEQMGGRRTAMMIGAHSFVGSENSVSFRFKARGRDGINAIRIVLDPSDTYTVEFLSLRGSKRTVRWSGSDIYAEDLRRLFESKTGLYLSL